MEKQRDLILNKIGEIKSAMESLEEIKPNSNVIFSLGGETYACGKLSSDKLLVEIGAGVVLEKSKAQAREMLEKRERDLERILQDLEKELSTTSNYLTQVEKEIRELVTKRNI